MGINNFDERDRVRIRLAGGDIAIPNINGCYDIHNMHGIIVEYNVPFEDLQFENTFLTIVEKQLEKISTNIGGVLGKTFPAFPPIIDNHPGISLEVINICKNLRNIDFQGSSLISGLIEKLKRFHDFISDSGESTVEITTSFFSNWNYHIDIYRNNIHHNEINTNDSSFDFREVNFIKKYNGGRLSPIDIWDIYDIREIINSTTPKARANILRIGEDLSYELEESESEVILVISHNSEPGEEGKNTRKKITIDILQELQELK